MRICEWQYSLTFYIEKRRKVKERNPRSIKQTSSTKARANNKNIAIKIEDQWNFKFLQQQHARKAGGS